MRLGKLGSINEGTLLATGFVVLLTATLISLGLIRESDVIGDRIANSLTATNLIANFRADTRRAESGQRGYLLTGEARYRADYDQAIGLAISALDRLEELLKERPSQLQHLAALRTLSLAKSAELTETVKLAETGRNDAAIEMLRSGRGLEYTEQILRHVIEMTAEERRFLDGYLSESDRTQILLFVINGLAGAIIAGLATLSILLVRRSVREAKAAHDELALLNVDLERRVSERTANLKEANDEIQRFAYIVSHDLRSPLVNIMGFTGELEALRNDVLTRAAQANRALGKGDGVRPDAADKAIAQDFDEALWFIRSSITKMDRLINAILEISRLGRREFRAEEIDLDKLVRTLAADFSHRTEKGSIRLSVGRLPTIVNDRLALEQIISNLIDNAVKYVRDEVPGQIAVTAGATDAPMVEISVVDNGRGIAERDLERIFDLFRRSGAQDRPGDGIGLAYVRTLVRRLGGTVRVMSRLGEGSTFTIVLPRVWTP